MSRILRRVAGISTAAGLAVGTLLAPRALAADQGVLLRSGDRLAAQVEPGDEDAFDVEVPEGGMLRFAAAASGKSELRPAFRLFRPDGAELDLSLLMRDAGGKSVSTREFTVPEGLGGRWQLRVSGAEGTVGAYKVTADVSPPSDVKLRGLDVPAGGQVTVPFPGVSSIVATCRVRTLDGGKPARMRVTDPDGADVPGSAGAFRRRPGKVFAGKVALGRGAGDYALVVEGDADLASKVDVDVQIRFRKEKVRRVRLPAETRVAAVEQPVVKQTADRFEVPLQGSGFQPGSTAWIDGEGVTVRRMEVADGGRAKLVVDVAADAPYGARRLVVLPPELLGESFSLADAVTVHAPDPTLADAAPDIVEQSTQGTLVLTGTGFRDGGTVSATDAGLTFSSPTRVSDTEFTVAYVAAANATLSLRDVTYTQPAEGGGASATLDDGFLVMPHAPEFSSISPGTLALATSRSRVRVNGGYFNAGTAVTVSGAGVTVHSTTFVNAGALDVLVSVAPDAPVGARGITITPVVATGGGPPRSFADVLTIAAPDPEVVSFSHVTLARGASTTAVTVLGRNFRAGDTLSASGTGVTFSGVTFVDSTRLDAVVAVTTGAATGLRSVTVAHPPAEGGRSATLADAFRVIAATPTVTSVDPGAIGVTAAGGPTREVPLRINGTNFMTGATVSISRTGGSGLTVLPGTERVVSDVRIDVTVSLAPGATIGLWDVRVANPESLGNSGTTGNGRLDVRSSSTLAINRVIADHGRPYGGERVTVQGSGFADGVTVDFGAVRAVGTQVLDANTLVVTVPVPATVSSTTSTPVNVRVNAAGGATATLNNGYTYARDDTGFVAVATVPAQGATSVPNNLRSAVVVLSAPLDPATGNYGTTTGVNSFWFESGGDFTPNGTRAVGPGNRFVVLSRTGGGSLPLANGGTYVLDVPTALRSRSGRAFLPTRLASTQVHDQYSFTLGTTTTDTTAPTIGTISPANGATNQDTTTRVVLTFSEALDPATVTATNVTFRQGTTAVAAGIDLSDDLRTVTITPERELAPSTTYTTGVTAGLTDLCGNAIAPTTRSFTTSGVTDTTAPSVTAVVVESLPASVDGSGTYVRPNGTAGQAFDLYLPRSGWSLDVAFSDAGGSGIDASTFSARCSVAVGTTPVNAELASNFAVTAAGARWTVPASMPVAAGDNVTFTFTVRDKAGNLSASSAVTVDVFDKDAGAAGPGDHDPFDARATWILRTDLDASAASITSRTSPSAEQGATTSAGGNGVPDLDEALRLVGLNTSSMSSASAATVNGLDLGTNAIVRRMFCERVRELLNERFGIAADGTRDADSVDVEFLLPGEQGSLGAPPTLSTASSSNSSKPFSEISLGGTRGTESNAYAASSTIGDAYFDVRNRREEANLNLAGASDPGVYLLGAFKLQVNGNDLFRARISDTFVAVHGGTPVGQDASDDNVLAGSFVRATSTNTTFNARYDAIHDAIEHAALYASAMLAHEIGHSLGLVADGGPKTGLFGGAHYGNTFTEATSAMPNTSNHLDFLGNDLMAAATTFDATTLTGSDFKRFGPLEIAYLLNRLIYDEGK